MKISKTDPCTAYAVAIATGIAQNGNQYAQVLVHMTDSYRTRSQWSLFLDETDKDLMRQLGNPTPMRSEDGSRLVTPFDTPIALEGNWVFITVDHAPYKVNDKIIRQTFTVVREGEIVETAAKAAVQRGFDRAESYFKSDAYVSDYRQFVLFELSREELDELLNGAKNLED